MKISSGLYEEKRRMESIVSAVSEKFGIGARVVEEGAAPAYFDGKNIVLSRLLLKELLKEREDKNVKAIVYHEAGHALASDMEMLKKADMYLKTFKSAGIVDEVVKHKMNIWRLFNSLEDVRIENKICKYVGVEKELKSFISGIVEALPEENLYITLTKGIYIKKRYSELLDKYLDKEQINILNSIKEIDKIDTAKDSKEVLLITGEVYNKLKKYVEEYEEEKKSEESGEGEEGEGDSDGEEGGEKEEKSGDKKSKSTDKDEKETKGKDKESVDKAIKEIDKEVEDIEKIPFEKKERSLPSLPVDCCADFDASSIYTIAGDARKGDKIEYYKKSDYKGYVKNKQEVLSHIGVTARRMKDIFVVRNLLRYTDGYSSGSKISSRDLWKVGIGKGDVFQQRAKEDKRDYAVSLLIDMSGSMVGCKIEEAKKSTILLAEVLDNIRVSFEILGFSTNDGVRMVEGGDVRWDCIRHYIFKAFEDSYDIQAKSRLGAMYASSQNWDGEAIIWAYQRLIEHKNRHKVLIVLSDGEPAGDNSGAGNCAFTKAVISKVQKKVYTIGIGYQTNYVKGYYKNYVLVNDTAQLSGTFINILKKVLSC